VKEHRLIVGLLSPFSDKVQAIREKTFRFEPEGFVIDFPAGGYLEKCIATLEARYRVLRAEDRSAIDAIIQFPS
jgi:hypothetical protein